MQIASLSQTQANQIVSLVGLSSPVRITSVSRHNHVWRLESDLESFFLKTYTKDWYGDDVAGTEYCVRHERDAYTLLASHGLPTVDVVLASTGCENPLERPFLLTRALPGVSLTNLLLQAEASRFTTLLEAAGDFMRRMHTISFLYPGYIIGEGPAAPPDPQQWQHACWTAQQMQIDALAMLEREQHRLSPETVGRLYDSFTSIITSLTAAFQPPRFVHGDCHAHQIFLAPHTDMWQVTGVLDLEVASAGNSTFDLVKFGLEMAAFFPTDTCWWEPFFYGYGSEPDFEQFRLHMLSCGEASFTCFGEDRWSGPYESILLQLLNAKTWEELFTT